MIEFALKYLDVNTQETIAYREAGNGKTILLLHGNMSSSVHFNPLMAHLAENYHVIALDLVGFGDSSYNREINSLKDFADDVISFIELKELKDITVVGWSTGGGIALEVAASLKDTVKHLVLLSSVGLQGFVMVDAVGNRISTKAEIASHPLQVVPILEAYKTGNKDFIKFVWDNTIYINDKPEEDEYDIYLDAILKQRNLVDVDYALVHFNFTNEDNGLGKGSNRIGDVKASVLILHGEKDLVVNVSEALKTKEAFGEQAKLIVFENAGHALITDNLELLKQVIIEEVEA